MKAFGLARVGRDVEVRHLQDGTPVANVSLAFTWGKKNAEGKRSTTWAEGSIWNKQAEALAPYLTKGTLVCVTLEDVHTETFTARDQTTGTKLVGRVASIDLAGSPQQAANAAPPPAPRPPPAPAPRPAAAPSSYDDIDSEIPF